MRYASLLVLLFISCLPCPAPGCGLCGNVDGRSSLVVEYQNADAVIFGRIANPKFAANGMGTTEFHIENVLKKHVALPKQQTMLLSRALPILDAKNPPRYLMFFAASKNRVEPYSGRQIDAPAVLDFLAEMQRHRNDPAKTLAIAGEHLDHADPLIAEEAFLVFARADDKHIGKYAKQLAPARLRKLVRTPDLEPERLSMFAYLLGACGNADDAELLRSLLDKPAEQNYKSYEGILAGYITLRPKEGWGLALEMLKADKTSLLLRYATLRTLRFYYNADPQQFGPVVMRGMGQAVTHSDLADIAIHDLRRWQRWEHTKLIVSCYDQKSHRSPIVQNGIVRYALACPLPEARTLVERVRRQDPELVRDLEEALKDLEK